MSTTKPDNTTRCACNQKFTVGIEYRGTREDYDGVSEWKCTNCNRRWGRWTGKELTEGELEPRYGQVD